MAAAEASCSLRMRHHLLRTQSTRPKSSLFKRRMRVDLIQKDGISFFFLGRIFC
jgi:hypothetical protein